MKLKITKPQFKTMFNNVIFLISILVMIYVIITNRVLTIDNTKLTKQVTTLDSISDKLATNIDNLRSNEIFFKKKIDSIILDVKTLYRLRKISDDKFAVNYKTIKQELKTTMDSINKNYPIINIIEQ